MNDTLTIRGRYVDPTFIPDGQMPDTEGAAELVVAPVTGARSGSSIADAFGTAPVLRSGDDLLAQGSRRPRPVGRPLINLDSNVVLRLVEDDAPTRTPLVGRPTQIRRP